MKNKVPSTEDYDNLPRANPVNVGPAPSAPPYDTHRTSRAACEGPTLYPPAHPLAQPLMYNGCCGSFINAPFQLRSYMITLCYHPLNFMHGIFAFLFLTVSMAFGVVLIPLCCCGLLVLRVVLNSVPFLARLEVLLYNMVSEDTEDILTFKHTNYGSSRLGLAPGLRSPLSLETFMAILYYLFIKFPLCTIGFMCGPWLWLTSITILLSPIVDFSHHHKLLFCFNDSCSSTNIFVSTTLGLIIWFLAITMSRALALLSMAITRWLLCQYLPSYVVIYTPIGIVQNNDHIII